MVGSPRWKNKNSGNPDPIAAKKKSAAAIIRDLLRPNFKDTIPEIKPPMIHPIRALEIVAP